MGWTKYLLLKKEANLFDSKLYIIKAFLAVIFTYLIANQLEFVRKDMISVLFGLLLTLEPVTMTGIRSGLRQIYATFLGALCTAIIISFFGINLWTIAFSISATLFLCLKINWREVSPVAIFTSIYMTQFIQLNAQGYPSVFLTFQLRIFALGIGVFSAILFNFLFALVAYKKMERKRIAFILSTLANHLNQINEGIKSNNQDIILKEKYNLPNTFNGIDWLASLIKDKEKEANLLQKLKLKSQYNSLVQLETMLNLIRSINHLIYDTAYILYENCLSNLENSNKDELVLLLNEASEKLNALSQYFEAQKPLPSLISSYDNRLISQQNYSKNRLLFNLSQINLYINQLISQHQPSK